MSLVSSNNQPTIAPIIAYADLMPFLPPQVQGELATSQQPLFFTWSAAERKVCRKRKDILASKWAEENRVLEPKDSARAVPWRNSVTPYMVGVMDAVFFPSVRQMVVCAPPQTAKSETVNNIVGKIIDRDPGQVLYVYPTEKDAKKNIKRRVLGMIKSSPALASYLTGYKDDESSALINLTHMMIRAGWAGSPQSLASTPERYVILEETDKYVDRSSSKETGVINLAKKRTRTFRGREKVIQVSTPTTEDGHIWQAMLHDSEVIFEYVVRCPKCFTVQPMLLGSRESTAGLKWPEDERDPNTVESKELAWYQCQCGAQWDDYLRDRAVAAGYWRQKTDDDTGLELFAYLERYRPKKIAFQYSALISTFVSLSEYAAAFLKGLKSKDALKDFANGYAAEAYTDFTAERDEDKILALRDDRPSGLVPGKNQVAALVAGGDTQDNGFYLTIWAVGYGAAGNWWLVRHEFVTSFAAMEQVLWQDEYRDVDGLHYPVQLAVLDSAGHRTAEVYEWCRLHSGLVLPSRGERTKAQPFNYSDVEFYPGTKTKFPGGLRRVNINTTYYKNHLSAKLEAGNTAPGGIILHQETTVDFARQMCAEYRDDAGFWQQIGSRPNHYFDCASGALVAADIIGLRYASPPEEIQQQQQQGLVIQAGL